MLQSNLYMPTDLRPWLGFTLAPGIGPQRLRRLLTTFGDAATAWNASASGLKAAGLEPRAAEALVKARSRLDLEAPLETMTRVGISALTWEDATYPSRLLEIGDPPPVLFIRGSLLPQDEWAVAVVGTRRASAYGRQVAETLATDLARRGITVVSGLARGIDAIAHRAALAAGGRTLALQACGLDLVYPPEHRQLALDIIKQGALLSEFPPGTKPQAQHFPRRNRLMSGICLGVLVVEADEKSGALITARFALEQDREVFAVPGSIFSPLSRGTNNLIERGEAKLVTSVEHILEELNLSLAEVQLKAREELSAWPAESTIEGEEARLLRVLSNEPQHIDEVAQQTGLPVSAVSGTLALLELKGLVRSTGAMRYIRAREPYPTYATE